MKKQSLFLIVLGAMCLTSCTQAPLSSSQTSSTSPTSSASSSSTRPEIETPQLYKDLFNPEKKVEIIADFEANAIIKLAEYGPSSATFEQKEMYHPAKVVIKIDDEVVFDDIEVGFRMRGNTSRIENFVDEYAVFGDRLCNLKMSFNETFDDEEDNDYYIRDWESKDVRKIRKDRTFADLKKIDLKWNKNYDNTFTKDAYAKYIYQEEGIVCQKATLAKVTLNTPNDSISAIFTLFEAFNSGLIDKNYDEESRNGNLYKAGYGCNLTLDSISGAKVGIEGKYNTPIYDLKTNDDEPNHDILLNTVKTLNNDRRSAAEFKSTLDELVNVDQVLKYCALAWVVGNPDDMRHNMNNTYIYFNSSNNKMEILPYDDDRCFGIWQDWKVDMSVVPDYTTKMAGKGRAWQENPLFWRLFLKSSDKNSGSMKWEVIEEYREKYFDYCKEFAEKYLNLETFQEFTDRFVLAPSKDITVGGGQNQSFKDYAENKIKQTTR